MSLPVALSTPDRDLGLVPLRGSRRIAQRIADETGQPISIRHIITDTVIDTVKPDRSAS